jgi:hypothetical protein
MAESRGNQCGHIGRNSSFPPAPHSRPAPAPKSKAWRAAVVRGGCAGFNVGLDKLVAARLAIGFALPLLIWNGDIMLGLPRRRDAQIEGGAQRHGHGRSTGVSAELKMTVKMTAR